MLLCEDAKIYIAFVRRNHPRWQYVMVASWICVSRQKKSFGKVACEISSDFFSVKALLQYAQPCFLAWQACIHLACFIREKMVPTFFNSYSFSSKYDFCFYYNQNFYAEKHYDKKKGKKNHNEKVISLKSLLRPIMLFCYNILCFAVLCPFFDEQFLTFSYFVQFHYIVLLIKHTEKLELS